MKYVADVEENICFFLSKLKGIMIMNPLWVSTLRARSLLKGMQCYGSVNIQFGYL